LLGQIVAPAYPNPDSRPDNADCKRIRHACAYGVQKVPDKTVKSVNRALIRAIRRSPLPVLTITADNGTEFHGYRNVEVATAVTIYFAQPYHPWEGGTNENNNGLLRQYWPKRNSMADVAQAQCNTVSHKLNTRPRKRHGYFSPLQLVA
jgi:transposase, IS30 family